MKENCTFCVEGEIFDVTTVRGPKTGRLISPILGQEPGTTKFWFRALKANSRVLVVRKGRADGILLRSVL